MEPGSEFDFWQALMRRMTARAGALLAALAMVFSTVPVSAQGTSITLEKYISLLEEAAVRAPEDSPALQELGSLTAVQLPDGTVRPVNLTWAHPGNFNLRARLDSALAEARADARPAVLPNRDPQTTAKEITDAAEFHQKKSLARRIKDAIDEFFEKLNPNRGRESPVDIDMPDEGANEIAQIVSFIVLAGVILLIAYLIWRRIRSIERAEEEDEEAEEIWDIGPADPEILDEMATTAAAEGRYSDAVRAGYLANLLRLDAKNVIRFHASATNGAFRRSLLRDFGGVVPSFDAATRIFEEVHYGGHSATAEDWERSRTAWDGVWNGVAA